MSCRPSWHDHHLLIFHMLILLHIFYPWWWCWAFILANAGVFQIQGCQSMPVEYYFLTTSSWFDLHHCPPNQVTNPCTLYQLFTYKPSQCMFIFNNRTFSHVHWHRQLSLNWSSKLIRSAWHQVFFIILNNLLRLLFCWNTTLFPLYQ